MILNKKLTSRFKIKHAILFNNDSEKDQNLKINNDNRE